MDLIKEFIVTFIELSAFMILWKKFSLKKKKTFFKTITTIMVTSLVMGVTSNMKISYNMIFSYAIFIFLVSYLYEKKIITVLLQFCLLLTLLMLLQLIAINSLNFFNLNQYLGDFLFNISGNFIVLIFAIAIYYLISDEICIPSIDSRIVYCFIVNFAAYIVGCKIIWDYDKNIILTNMLIFILILSILLILNLILYRYVIKINEERKAMLIQTTYNPIFNNILEEIRSKQHDFKNHLNTINGIVETAKDEEVKDCVKQYIKSLNYSSKSIENIIYIKNPILGAVIYSKSCEAKNNNINFLYCVNNDLKDLNIKDYELSEILTNLLDNGFEAVRNKENKEVILNITNMENHNIIEVKNRGITIKPENISKIFERSFSTKEGKNRGYGLYNVKKIVERNGGNIQLFFEDNYTIFKILF